MTSTADAPTVVHLVRHGEVHNPERVLYGRLPDYHLSELGRAMADLAAKSLADNDVMKLVSSPLERAQETAAPFAASHNVPIELDERLLEAENKLEGRAVAGGQNLFRDPKLWWNYRNPLRPSWGEPYREIVARMLAVITDVRDEVAGHEAVLVSHQLPIWMARTALEGRRLWHDPRNRQCSLASVTSVHYRGSELVKVSYAEPAKSLLPQASKVAGA